MGTKMENASVASAVAKGLDAAAAEPKTTKTEILASIALAGLSIAPLFVRVDPNVNVVLTACLTVYVGCHKSVKPAPPSETMSKEHAMQFPFIGSAVLFSLFLLFKFLPKELVNKCLTAYFAFLGVLALIATVDPFVSKLLPAKWSEHMHLFSLPLLKKFEFEYTRSHLVSAIPSIAFCAWYVLTKHWLANNTLGLAFSVQGIEMLSLGSFKIGAILLAGLFVYDIFWVFCTPVMVSVAKSFDAPIKLLFPTGVTERPFSMLGLGDIVIPGIFVALALRFDRQRPPHTRHYFVSAFAGYFAGVLTTIIVMNRFQAAQPALLYIVPGVIGFLGVHCLVNGELQPLLAFDESSKEEEQKESTDGSIQEGDPLATKKDN